MSRRRDPDEEAWKRRSEKEAHEILTMLHDQKKGIDALSAGGMSALQLQATNPRHNRATEIARALIEEKADVNLATKDGYTALHLAARHGNVSMVQLLLESKADLTSPAPGLLQSLMSSQTSAEDIDLPRTSEGETALSLAKTCTPQKTYETIRALILKAKSEQNIKKERSGRS